MEKTIEGMPVNTSEDLPHDRCDLRDALGELLSHRLLVSGRSTAADHLRAEPRKGVKA
jgi:hypothetical protein